MAIRDTKISGGNGINITKEIDDATDHAGLANDTYFRQLDDGLIKWKDNTGAVIGLFDLGGGVSDGDKGDVTVSSGGTQWDIDNDVVTYAKIQDVTDERLLGNFSGVAGDVQEISLSPDLQVLLGVLGLNTKPLYISDVTTVNLLDDVANWDLNGNYTGTLITGTFQGQHHVNSTYWFTCTHDNVWIRTARI